MASHAKRVVINTGFLYGRMVITVFISLYSTRLILNALGTNDFGIFNVVGGAITMLTFINTSMAVATQRYMSYAQGEGNIERQKSVFNVSIVLHLITGVLVIIILEAVGLFLFDGMLKIDNERLWAAKVIYHLIAISTFFTISSVPYEAVINAHENMFLVAILGLFEAFIKLGFAIIITHISTDKLVIYGLLMALLPVFLLISRQIYCHHKYDEVEINIRGNFNKLLFKEMTRFAGWSFLGTSTSMITNYGQSILINTFFGTRVNAAQGIANQVTGQLSSFAGTMLKALNPMIIKSEGSGDRSLMLKASLFGSKISFFLLMLFFVPVLIEMPLIFKFWLKEVPEYSIIFCRLLLIRVLIEQLYVTLISSISAVGNIKKFHIFNSILNIITLFSGYVFFLMKYPAFVIYIIYIIYSILGAIITLYFAKRDCNLSISIFFNNVISRCVVSFIISFILSSIPIFIIADGIVRVFLVLVISFITFLFSVWLLGFTNYERISIIKMITSFQKK